LASNAYFFGMDDARREILDQVAAGTLSPAEAAGRLEEVAGRPAPQALPPEGGGRIRGVRISSSFGRLVVRGDAGVDEAVAEGAHGARREDGLMVIEAEPDRADDFWFSPRDGRRWWEGILQPTLTVRVNPRLELWVSADAGSVNIRDVTGPVHAEVQAGTLAVEGFEGTVDLAASAGSIRAAGRLVEGTSHIRCEMGSTRVLLAPGSDVRVSVVTELGRVSLDPEGDGRDRQWGGKRRESVYGKGTARLEIASQVGSVTVSRAR
jgi:hypothetical protein